MSTQHDPNEAPSWRQREADDLGTLLLCLALVPLAWLGILGWRPGQSVMGQDGIHFVSQLFQQALSAGGDWRELRYRPDLLGGIELHGAVGTLPWLWVFAKAGASLPTALNGSVFLLQSLYAFLGVRAARDLASLWGMPSGLPGAKKGLAARLGLILLLAFTPVLGWKLGYGHLPLILGTLPWLSGISLLIASARDRLTLTIAGVALVAMVNGFSSMGQQAILNSLVFGLPILAGILFSVPRTRAFRLSTWLAPSLVTLAALGLVAPRLVPMLEYATGADAARSLGGEAVTFSYLVGNLRDWLGSLFWSREIVPTGRWWMHDHEVNYPFGPLLAGLALIPFRKGRALVAGLLVSLLASVLFSLDFKPVSGLFLDLVPWLKAFRVAERAVIPFALFLPIAAAAAILFRLGASGAGRDRRAQAMLAAAFFTFAVLPSIARELAGWGVVLIAVASAASARFPALGRLRPRYCMTGSVALILLAGAGLGAFRERLILPFVPLDRVHSDLGRMRQGLTRQNPELGAPLTRIQLQDFSVRAFANNSGMALGLSALSGYWPPQRRFAELVHAMSGVPFDPTRNNFRLDVSKTDLAALRKLYNVTSSIGVTEAKELAVASLGETAGPAWFSGKLTSFDSLGELAAALKDRGAAGQAVSRLTAEALYLLADPSTRAIRGEALPATADPGCARSTVQELEARRGGQSFRLRVNVLGELCPLTISMNYSSSFEARALDPASSVNVFRKAFRVFPSYGALTGVLVSRGTHEFVIAPRANLPLWARLAPVASILILFGLVAAIPASFSSVPAWRVPAPALRFAGLLVLALAVYAPALQGDFLGIDDKHYILDNPRVTEGPSPLAFWTGLEGVDYWPIHYTALWSLWKVFGRDPLPFHLVNVILHALNAALFFGVLKSLRIRFAALAAAVFLVHPVNVPAVAWIFQLKTLLSTSFFLLACRLYLSFDERAESSQGSRELLDRRYLASTAAFAAALLTKTSAAMFPVTLVLYHAWKGTLASRGIARRLVVPALLAAASVLITVGLNARNLSSVDSDLQGWRLSLAQRPLAAGSNFWFYARKLLFPSDLLFTYPHAAPDPRMIADYLPMLLLAVVIGALILLWRKGFRSIAFGLGFYFVNLGPALGFVDIPYFRISLVADHWQYLASLGAIAVFSAVVGSAGSRVVFRGGLAARGFFLVSGCVLVGALAALSLARAGAFAGSEALWRHELSVDPRSAPGWYNLGVQLLRDGRKDEAIRAFERSLAHDPLRVGAELNLAGIAIERDDLASAERRYRSALSKDSRSVMAHYGLGVVLQKRGRMEEALSAYDRALSIRRDVNAFSNRCSVLHALKRFDEAEKACRDAIAMNLAHAPALTNLGAVLLSRGRMNEAIAVHEKLVELFPSEATFLRLARALIRNGERDYAEAMLKRALSLNPESVESHRELRGLGR